MTSRSPSIWGPTIFSGLDELMSFPFPSALDLMKMRTPTVTKEFTGESTMFRRSSPFYEITEDEDRFQLAIDLPGVKASDIKCDIENGDQLLHVSGGRKIKLAKGEQSESRFDKTFTIDKSVDAKSITANLHDGVLIITAPKNKKFKESNEIAVTQEPYVIPVTK